MPTMRGRWETGILAATVIVIAVVLAIERVRVHGRAYTAGQGSGELLLVHTSLDKLVS